MTSMRAVLSRLPGSSIPLQEFVHAISWMLSELDAESQVHLAIVNTGQGRWRLVRIVQPGEEIAVNEELLA